MTSRADEPNPIPFPRDHRYFSAEDEPEGATEPGLTATASDVRPQSDPPSPELERSAPASPAVRPSNRNGYASVLGTLADLLAEVPGTTLQRSRFASITREAEARMKTGDVDQLGVTGLAVARSGTSTEWRAFLRSHLRREYGLEVLFDAPAMRVE